MTQTAEDNSIDSGDRYSTPSVVAGYWSGRMGNLKQLFAHSDDAAGPLAVARPRYQFLEVELLSILPFPQLADEMLLRKCNLDHVTDNPARYPTETLPKSAGPSIQLWDAPSS